MNWEIGEPIGRSIGGFIKANIPIDDVGWGSFLRIRVEFDIQKPMTRGHIIKVNSNKMWIPICYDNLPNI